MAVTIRAMSGCLDPPSTMSQLAGVLSLSAARLYLATRTPETPVSLLVGFGMYAASIAWAFALVDVLLMS